MSFLEVILGTFVGGILTYFAVMRAARFTMERTACLDRQHRDEERAEIHRRFTAQLLEEIRDNIRILEEPGLDWGYPVLLHEIWDMAKGRVLFATPEIGESVRQAYTQVYRYNALVAAATVDRGSINYTRTLPMVGDRGIATKAALERAAEAIDQGAG